MIAAGFLVAWMVWFAAVQAHATPIRPDIQHIVAEPATPTQFVPARAGWQGSELPRELPPTSPLNEQAVARAARASIVAAAIPDPRAVIAIAAAILLLRWMRLSRGRQQHRPEPVNQLPDIPRAA